MRLLAFSDLHRSRRCARELVARSREADVLVGAGDFTSMRLGLGGVLEWFAEVHVPCVLVAGNNESTTALSRAAERIPRAVVLHGEGTTIAGHPFWGVGGAVPPAPTPWSWNITEARAAQLLAGCPQDAVLVVHAPPHGAVDLAFGRHLGSRAIRSAIERRRPRVALCGHVHQCQRQEDTIGDTRVVNLGPAGVFIDL